MLRGCLAYRYFIQTMLTLAAAAAAAVVSAQRAKCSRPTVEDKGLNPIIGNCCCAFSLCSPMNSKDKNTEKLLENVPF